MDANFAEALAYELPAIDTPLAKSIAALAADARRRVPSEVWGALDEWVYEASVAELRVWIEAILVEQAGAGTAGAVYFLLFDTELVDGAHGQDLYAHVSASTLDEDAFDEWDKPEPLGRSRSSAFEWIEQHRGAFMALDGAADYGLALTFSLAAVYECIATSSNAGALDAAEGMGIGVGYRWGDTYHLGAIGRGGLVGEVVRLA